MKNVWPDVVAAYVGAGANPNDPEVARNPQLYLLYGQLQKYQADMAKGIMSRDTKKELAYLKERTAQLKSVADVSRELVSSSASASAASANARAGIYKSAQRTSQELAEFMTQADQDQLMEIRQAAGRGGEATPKDLITQAFSVKYRTVDPALPESKNALGTYNAVLVQAGVEKGLQNPDPVAALRAAGVNVPEAMAVNIGAVKEKFDNAGSLLETAQSIVDMEEKGEKILGKFQAGASLKSQQGAEKAQKALADAALEMEEKAKGFYGDPESAYKELQRFYEEGVNEYARYGEVLNALATGIIGDKKDLTPRGELVQSPQFQRWAKSNGVNVENLGYISKSGRYIEGPDDTKAIALYQYQMRNPNKLSPFVSRGKSSGEIQVIEKAMSPEELARFEQVGNKFLVRKDADGEHYLDKNDTLVKAASTGAIVLSRDKALGQLVVTPKAGYEEFLANMQKYESVLAQLDAAEDLSGEERAAALERLEELGAVVDATPNADEFSALYDLQQGNSTQFEGLDEETLAGIFDVDFVDENGVFQDADPMRFNEAIGKLSGSSAEFSSGEDFLKAVAPGVEFTDKPPFNEVVVEVPVEHALDTREGVTTLKVDTAAGPLELALDDKDKEGGWRVVSTEQLEGDWSKASMRRRMTPDEKLADVRKDEAKEEAAAARKEKRKEERAQVRAERATPATEPATAKDPVLQRFSKYLRGSEYDKPQADTEVDLSLPDLPSAEKSLEAGPPVPYTYKKVDGQDVKEVDVEALKTRYGRTPTPSLTTVFEKDETIPALSDERQVGAMAGAFDMTPRAVDRSTTGRRGERWRRELDGRRLSPVRTLSKGEEFVARGKVTPRKGAGRISASPYREDPDFDLPEKKKD